MVKEREKSWKAKEGSELKGGKSRACEYHSGGRERIIVNHHHPG